MARTSGRPEADMPVFDADAPAAGTLSGRATPGRRQGRSRGVGVAVGLLALLIGGVAIGGIIDRPPEPSPDASDVALATTTPTISPDCRPASRGAVPSFRLIGDGDTGLGAAGVKGFEHRPGQTTQGVGWQVPPIGDGTVHVEAGVPIAVRTEPNVCLRAVIAEYADAAVRPRFAPSGPALKQLAFGPLQPPQARPILGSLPTGEWVVRVVAYFWTNVDGAAGQLAGERYFRVQVGGGPFATPTDRPTPSPRPQHTADIPCGPNPVDAAAVQLVLRSDGVDPVDGVTNVEDPPLVELPFGAAIELDVANHACATSWEIRLLDEATSTYEQQLVYTNPTNDPAIAIQNHWRLGAAYGTYTVAALLHFGPDVEVLRVWRVIYGPFPIPKLFLVAADGSRVEALPGCGLDLELGNGYSASDECGSIGYEPGVPLRAPVGSVVAVELEGWEIVGWSGHCGEILVDEGGLQQFSDLGCDFGSAYSDTDEPIPFPARFVVREGEYIIAFGMRGAQGRDRFGAAYYATVIGE